MIIQQSKTNTYVNLDKSSIKFMGWKKGEEVQISCDKEKDSITITRIKEE